MIRTSVDEKIDSFIKGDLRHATEIVSALWEIVNKDGDIYAPSNASPAVSQPVFPVPWQYWRTHFMQSQSDRTGREPHPLGLCEDGTHKVDPQRRLLR